MMLGLEKGTHLNRVPCTSSVLCVFKESFLLCKREAFIMMHLFKIWHLDDVFKEGIALSLIGDIWMMYGLFYYERLDTQENLWLLSLWQWRTRWWTIGLYLLNTSNHRREAGNTKQYSCLGRFIPSSQGFGDLKVLWHWNILNLGRHWLGRQNLFPWEFLLHLKLSSFIIHSKGFLNTSTFWFLATTVQPKNLWRKL